MKTPSPQEAAKTVRELPILFAPDLAQKVYLGLKTETRRLVNPQPRSSLGPIDSFHLLDDGWHGYCGGFRSAGPFKAYQPGDVLYVRETFVSIENPANFLERVDFEVHGNGRASVAYRGAQSAPRKRIIWTPSIHMPKWAARTWLEVLSVSVEKIRDIKFEDCIAEGYKTNPPLRDVYANPPGDPVSHSFFNERSDFYKSWNARYPGSWDRNDWVFVYKFKKVEAPNGRA